MKIRATLVLTAFLSLGVSGAGIPIASGFTGNPDGVTELAKVEASRSTGFSAAQTSAGHQTAAPFEPLLLLLLGSTLFALGTAIKLVLSRQFQAKEVLPVTSGKTTVVPGLVGLEPVQGGD